MNLFMRRQKLASVQVSMCGATCSDMIGRFVFCTFMPSWELTRLLAKNLSVSFQFYSLLVRLFWPYLRDEYGLISGIGCFSPLYVGRFGPIHHILTMLICLIDL